MSTGVVALTALRASNMAKKKLPEEMDILATGLAALIATQKFYPADANSITEAFGEIMAAVSRSKDCEERLEVLERELKSAREKKKAPV